MGINPDAYMSGAIPGLSRGGSWQNVQDPYSSPHEAMQQSGGSIYPRPSQIVPPGSTAPHPGMGNRSNSHFAQHHHHHTPHHPWAMNPSQPQSPLSQSFAPSSRQSYFGGAGSQGSGTGYSASMVSGKAPSVGPTRHPGWTNLNGQYLGVHTAPSSPTAHSGRTTPRSAAVGHPPRSFNAVQLRSPSSASGLPIQQQYEWEWASGSPKPMAAEADYFGVQNENHRSTSAHDVTPPTSARIMTLRLPPKRAKTVEALPPPPQSGRLRHESMRQKQAKPQRPMPQRRHTHDRFSPEDPEARSSRHDSRSLGRQRRKERDISVAGESYYAPSKSSEFPKSYRSAPHSHSPRAGSRRAESLLSTQAKATSLTERRLKQTGRPALPTIVSNSTVDFTSTDPSVIQSARPDRSAFELSDMAGALPLSRATASPGMYTHSPDGYAPTEEQADDYDRYMAHPAAPTPVRNEAPKTAPPLRMDLKIVKPEDYRPPAFPAPTKPLAWNRDGPAMKTHGVAWGREAPEGQLPTGPAGPRWAQARPPRLDIQQTGNWWESGVG